METTPPEPRSGSRCAAAIALGLLAGYAVWTVAAMRLVGTTVDEPTLILGARQIFADGGWIHPLTRLQGPIPLYFNQLLLGARSSLELDADNLFLARLGMLPFGLLAGAVSFLWARQAFGRRAALLTLVLFCLNPLMIGYGALVAVDMAHTACTLLALYLLWRYLLRPNSGRVLACGLALGVAFATKYLALLLGPVFAAMVALRAWRRPHTSPWRAPASAILAVALLAAAATLALHACYGFQPGPATADPALYRSDLIRHLVALPPPMRLVCLLPNPMLAGIDYQFSISREPHVILLNGWLAHGHSGYYLWCLLLKTPEAVLALVALAVLLATGARIRGQRATPPAAATWLVLLAAIAVTLAYLSLFNRVQIGIRYILPLYPPIFLLAGSAARFAPRHPRVIFPLAAALLAALLALETAGNSPNLIAYYNTSSGGQARAYRHFIDSNSDWGQLRRRGLEDLRGSESEPFQVLGAASGPRIGRVAIYVVDLQGEAERIPGRAHHWLDPFDPIRHAGAAWYLFEVTRAEFERAARKHGDPLIGANLAIACLGAGDRAGAQLHLALLDSRPAAAARRILALHGETGAPPTDLPTVLELARCWNLLGRFDRTRALLADEKLLAQPGARFEAALALGAMGLRAEAIDLLESSPQKLSDPNTLALLFNLYCEVARFAEAVALVETRIDDLPPDLRRALRPKLEQARALRDAAKRLKNSR